MLRLPIVLTILAAMTCQLAPRAALAREIAPPEEGAREDVTFSEGDLGRRIVEFVESAEARGFSGAVLAAKGGRVLAAVGAGPADLAGEHRNTPATLFEIASVTKQFTAAAVMRLVQDGRLKLDDSIAEHLPGVPDDCLAITVEHLLRHTSGIPGSNSQGGGDDIDAVLPLFLRGGPAHTPGTHWEYWNQGYAILTEIIRRASAGTEYTAYCKESLFAPAGLRATYFTGDAAPTGMMVAVGRSAYGPPRSALDHPYGSYGFQYRGMGGAVSSVWDLWRWDRALHGEEVLGEAAKWQLFSPGLRDYALGWFVRKDARGRTVHSHGGGVRGFICEVRRYPDEGAMLAVLCNRDDAPLRQVVQALEAMLFDDPAAQQLRPLGSDFAAALAGRYQGERGDVLTVESEGATTRARIHWRPPDGPVTDATLRLNDQGQLVLDDGSDLIALEVEREGDQPIQSVSILGRVFRRLSPEAPAPARGDALSIDPGMDVMMSTRPYQTNEHGVAHLPPRLTWRVMPEYTTIGEDGRPIVDDRITLVLHDAAGRFWPMIARMDTDVAERLVRDLQVLIEGRRRAVE